MFPSEALQALQTSECNELLGQAKALCRISAESQPGKMMLIQAPALIKTAANYCQVRLQMGLVLPGTERPPAQCN